MKVLITGSSGLIGSELTTFFDSRARRVTGIDNNMRADFFGPEGDTDGILRWLDQTTRHFRHREVDIRDRSAVVVHRSLHLDCRSHRLARSRPFFTGPRRQGRPAVSLLEVPLHVYRRGSAQGGTARAE